MSYPLLPNEPQRLEALRRLSISKFKSSAALERICRVARQVFDVPTSLVTFLDAEHLWIKAKAGPWDLTKIPREHAFCNYTVLHDEVFVVPDARAHPDLTENPLVLADPAIRFYAGAPLVIESGIRIGALCILDRKPRAFDPHETTTLSGLARLAVDELWLHHLTQTGRAGSNVIPVPQERSQLDFNLATPLTREQVRGARAMLHWSVTELAEAAGVSPMTIKRIEAQGGETVRKGSLAAVQQALEGAGLEFSFSSDEGVGLRLKP